MCPRENVIGCDNTVDNNSALFGKWSEYIDRSDVLDRLDSGKIVHDAELVPNSSRRGNDSFT